MSASPKVDHQYWFDYSKDALDAALIRRDEAAARIQRLVTWLWGIYTGSTAIGFALFEKSLPNDAMLVILGGNLALIVVYWATVWVQVPVARSFDPRSPTEIRAAHGEAVRLKQFRLNVTLFLALAAGILVSLAIVTAALAEPVVRPSPAPEYRIETEVARRGDPNGAGVVWGLGVSTKLTGMDRVELRVTRESRDAPEPKPLVDEFYPVLEGLLQVAPTFRAPAGTTVRLDLSWTDRNGLDVQVSKRVALPEVRESDLGQQSQQGSQ